MFKTNRYLFIASTIGIVSVACLMLFYRHLTLSSLVDHETRSNVALTEVFSNSIWSRYRYLLESDRAEEGATGVVRPVIHQLDADVKHLMRGSKVVKVKVYDLRGLTLYSSDPSQIGQDKSDNKGFLSARAGEAASNITFRDEFDAFEGKLSDLNMVSSYIPIRNRSSNKPEAVFEVYSDVTDLIHQMRRVQWQIVIGVLGSVAIIYALLLVASHRVDRIEATRREEAASSDAQIRHQAAHDSLTGLVNRREFERQAERLLSTIRQDKGEHALCFMDLDQFKVVNDTCGHIAGDEFLRQLSMILQHGVRKSDTLARLGGDEFGVLMEHCSLDHAHRIAISLQKAIQDYQFTWEENSFRVGVSIGLVAITEAIPNLTELLKQADAACYMAKDLGRNRIHVYHSEDLETSQRHGEMQWVSRIHRALEKHQFCLYAQVIVPLDGSTDKHYELLLRMKDEKGKIIPPGAFLPAAERYNLITKLDRWVIANAFSLLADNPVFLKQIDFCAINLSGQSLGDNDFLDFIITQLAASSIEGAKICFEITETAAISNLGAAMKFISTLRGLNCRFALDDFGSGVSSFGYLKNLPVNYLKIDGMFVRDVVDDPIDHAMVKSINEIGQVMGMKTIAEFVENDEIKGMLREIGVNYAQGYGIAKPLAFDELLGRSNKISEIKIPKVHRSSSQYIQ